MLSTKIYKKNCIHRYDEIEYLYYFKKEDFSNLKEDKYSFTSKGKKLNGGFYYYDGYKPNLLVIFCHGIGGGYSSYMREIERIARGGYKVLAFDYIGCNQSEGEDTISMTESLVNLKACISSLIKNKLYIEENISVVGHSWGGFATLNIINYYPNIHSIVDISGFITIKNMAKNFTPGILSLFKNGLIRYEKKMNREYYNVEPIKALNNYRGKALIIHDKMDNMVSYSLSGEILKENVKNKNVEFYITENKLHQPQYTYPAVKYYYDTFTEFKAKSKVLNTIEAKKEFFKDVDWFKMTEPDEEIYEKIFKTLE